MTTTGVILAAHRWYDVTTSRYGGLHIAPVLLGDGVRFHGGVDVGRIDLERTALADSGHLPLPLCATSERPAPVAQTLARDEVRELPAP
jgi:hypothetical protein